jgi:hydrogenase maturation protease
VGNLLFKDEGVGVHVVQRLAAKTLPPGVQAIDCGTSLLDAVSFIAKSQRLIVVDAIKTGAEPGTIFRLQDKDILETPRKLVSLHQLTLLESLEMADRLGKRPPTTILGVEPKLVEMGTELSPEIEHVIPKVLDLILAELSS